MTGTDSAIDLLDLAEDPAPAKWTERDMLDLLRAKYTRPRLGTAADRYVRAEHVRLPTDWYGGDALRIADYLVLDTYRPQQMLGFEVKVSRSDWLTELRDPTKAEAWKRYCHRWYLAVPDTAIVRDDLPEGWGLIALDATGQLRIRRRAPELMPDPMPWHVLASLGRSIAQTATKESRP